MAHSKKKVDVRVTRPFNIGFAAFAGFCPNIILSLQDIVTCLENKAYVSEVLKNGTRRSLDFSNYDKFDDMSIDVEKNMLDTNPEKGKVNVTTITKSDAVRMQNSNPKKNVVVDAIQNLQPKNSNVSSITAAEAKQAAKQNEEEKKAAAEQEAQAKAEERPQGQFVEQQPKQDKKEKHKK